MRRWRLIPWLIAAASALLAPDRLAAQPLRLEGIPDIYIPILTFRDGVSKTAVGLRYDPSSRLWRLENGTQSVRLDGGGSADTLAVFGGLDGHAFRSMRLEGMPSVSRMELCGEDSLFRCVYHFAYTDSLLSGIACEDGYGSSFSFVDTDSGIRLGSLCNLDRDGRLLRRRDFEYGRDTLTGQETVRETVSDSVGVTEVFLRTYQGAHMETKETYSGDGVLQRRITYGYVTLEQQEYPSYKKLETFLPPTGRYPYPTVVSSGSEVVYSLDPGRHYPLEVRNWKSGGERERVTYTYPFCAGEAYGPMADSLLARGMDGSVLSMTRWRDSAKIDSAVVAYAAFPSGSDSSHTFLRPFAVLYGKGRHNPDTCIRYLAYDSLGIQAIQTLDEREQGARHVDPRLTRWVTFDPVQEQLRAMRVYDYCAADPTLTVDWEEGENFLFDEGGFYLGRVDAPSGAERIILWQGYGRDPIVAQFVDPENDPATIDMSTQVSLVSKERIRASLEEAGAFDPSHHGVFKGSRYLARNSGYGGVLDFAVNGRHGVYDRVLYITQTLQEGYMAQNNYNYGNFLWGATACELGVPVLWAQLGAHFNNFFLSPDTKGTFDSRDDQFSIRMGYHWK